MTIRSGSDAEPCIGCSSRPACALGLACEAFASWYRSGRTDPGASRRPRAALYARLFPPAEVDAA